MIENCASLWVTRRFVSGQGARHFAAGRQLSGIIVRGISKARKGERYDLKRIYPLSRGVELGGNPFGIRRGGGFPDRETAERLDRAFFNDHGFDERDRIPVSVP